MNRLDNPSLHNRIEELRQSLNLTQPQFAVALGMDEKKGRSTVNNWESGANKVKDDALKHIAETFGVSSDWLLGLVDDKSPKTEIRAMRDYTGLSDESLFMLNHVDGISKWINAMVKDSASDLVIFVYAFNHLIEVAQAAESEPGDTTNYDKLEDELIKAAYSLQNSFQNLSLKRNADKLISRINKSIWDNQFAQACEMMGGTEYGKD